MHSEIRVKVCGITRPEDAELARVLGAWAVGFIFYEKSPRFIHPKQVRNIVESQMNNVTKTGVFVNASLESICETVKVAHINAIQLHGDESPDLCLQLKQKFPDCLLIKAFQPKTRGDLAQLKTYAMCDHILLDCYDEVQRGGTGKTGDWELALEAKKLGSVILAGGLDASNVKAAIDHVSPYALDVSSLLEDAPGIKNGKKMKEFFAMVKK